MSSSSSSRLLRAHTIAVLAAIVSSGVVGCASKSSETATPAPSVDAALAEGSTDLGTADLGIPSPEAAPDASVDDSGDSPSSEAAGDDVSTETSSLDGGDTADTGTAVEDSLDAGTTDSATSETTTDAASETTSDAALDSPSDATTEDTPLAAEAGDTGSEAASETAGDVSTAIAWGASCTRGAVCAAPTGESGSCTLTLGQPICGHSCNAQADWTLCEGALGICVPQNGGGKLCVKKCGDADAVTCGAGSSCAAVGFRRGEAGLYNVGVCVPDCTTTGPDACAGTGTACDTDRRRCGDIGCPDGCPTGSTCSGSACLPTPTVTPLYGSCKLQTAGVSNGCASGLCFAAPSPETGFCGTFCNSESGTATCGTGGTCWLGNEEQPSESLSDGGLLAGYLKSFRVVGGRTAGACIKKCSDSTDCPNQFFCGTYNGERACLPHALERATPSTGSGIPGSVCRISGDCVSGNCLKEAGFADGICARASTSTACPAGTTAFSASSLQCNPTCTGSAHGECRASLVCLATATTCEVGLVCRDNADCAAGYVCDPAASECRSAVSTAVGSVGDVCTTDPNCKGWCIAASAPSDAGTVTWPGGYCSAGCTILPELADTCPAGSLCTADYIGTYGLCVDLCDSAGTPARFGVCRSGYKCSAFASDPRYGFCTTNI